MRIHTCTHAHLCAGAVARVDGEGGGRTCPHLGSVPPSLSAGVRFTVRMAKPSKINFTYGSMRFPSNDVPAMKLSGNLSLLARSTYTVNTPAM